MHAFARFLCFFGPFALANAVALDAWHAHGLKGSLGADAYVSFGRALDQHYILGLALLATGCAMRYQARRGHVIAGALFTFGLFAFCGDVYLGALGHANLGIAPKGGMAHILGWLFFAGTELFRARPPKAPS
ncbi:MAG: DUF423 domain-containing protein [Planctomycetes bacterium]|nr:DUF423 domain-containing protein [Planctomycetota bacterium]